MPHPYRKRIVIIDDYEDTVDELTQILTMGNFSVKVTENGSCGIELVKAFLPKIVLCNLNLSDISGMEVAHALRALSPVYRPFLVSMSHWGDFHTISGAIAAGFDLHLTKPINNDQILVIVEKAYSHPLNR